LYSLTAYELCRNIGIRLSYLIKKIRLFNSNPLILYYNVISIPFATSKGDNKSIVRLPSLVRGMSNPYHSLLSHFIMWAIAGCRSICLIGFMG
jgi:hypothetical protein